MNKLIRISNKIEDRVALRYSLKRMAEEFGLLTPELQSLGIEMIKNADVKESYKQILLETADKNKDKEIYYESWRYGSWKSWEERKKEVAQAASEGEVVGIIYKEYVDKPYFQFAFINNKEEEK